MHRFTIFAGVVAFAVALVTGVTLAEPPTPNRDGAVPNEWLTPSERSDFQQTPRYDETIAFCCRLAEASPLIRVTSFGISPLGRELPLVIVSKGGATPTEAHQRDRVVLLVQNGIHAGECDGKDGALMLLRDIATGKIEPSLFDSVVLLVIPIFNVDGHERFGPHSRINQNGPQEMGWRTTSRNLNLNRDYIKADAVETRAWLKLWNAWNPDFHVDTHTTDGGDWQYDVMLAWERNANAPAPVVDWMSRVVESELFDVLRKDGHLPVPYFDLVDGKAPSRGVVSGAFEPRFSTGYAALRNRPSILVESHMLKPYKTRVLAQYHVLHRVLELVAANADSLREVLRRADAADGELGQADESPQPVVLSLRPTDAATPFTMKGVAKRLEPSDISGAQRIIYDNAKPVDIESSWYKSVEVDQAAVAPFAYVIPPQWTEVIELVEAHGLRIERPAWPLTVDVEGYRLQDVKFAERPFEGRFRAQFHSEKFVERCTFPAGSAIVPVGQVGGRLAMHLLEPAAPDSFAAWGFFNTIFVQKEYADSYVLEALAQKMLDADAKLKEEFAAKVASDEKFAADPRARLHYFYQRSPFADVQLNLYPIFRIPRPPQNDATSR